MITYVKGNLFESPAQVLVNTVNTDGVMGKGLALEFKRIYPEMFLEYRQLCERRQLDVGKLHLFKTRHKWILNFPTKRHWRQPSRVEYIETGLAKFTQIYAESDIHSIAFPPLGCGNGQLDFASQVKPLMEKYLRRLPIPVFVYPMKPAAYAPEHMDAKTIGEWLRSEPASLPFEEVWEDIREIVERQSTFQTSAGNPYTIEAIEEPPTLLINTDAGKNYRIEHEVILEFWQQLRQFGFSFSGIASEHARLSYLIPLFDELDYVRRVTVSTSEGGLEKNSAVALQVVPPARSDDDSPGDLFVPSVNAR